MNRLIAGGPEPTDVFMVDSENQTPMSPLSPMAAGFRRNVNDDEVPSGDRRNGGVVHPSMCFYIEYHSGGHQTRIEIGGVGCGAFLIALLRLVTFT